MFEKRPKQPQAGSTSCQSDGDADVGAAATSASQHNDFMAGKAAEEGTSKDMRIPSELPTKTLLINRSNPAWSHNTSQDEDTVLDQQVNEGNDNDDGAGGV